MKLFWRISKWLLLGFLGLLLLYALLALICSWWSTNPPKRDCNTDKVVYVTTGGVHLDIVIPTAYLPARLRHPSYEDSRATHVAFGWGERNFFLETPTWGDLTLKNGAGALLVNSEAIMHLRNYQGVQKSWKEVRLCDVVLEQLLGFVEQSFKKTTNGEWKEIVAEGYSEHDFFYAAKGKYNGINTCNVWLNNALKAAEVKTSRWSPLKYGILYHLEK